MKGKGKTGIDWSEPEKQLLKQAVETGRKENKTNTAIADALIRDDMFPGRTKTSLLVKMANLTPKKGTPENSEKPKTKKVDLGMAGANAYNKVLHLLHERKTLTRDIAGTERKMTRAIKKLNKKLNAVNLKLQRVANC